MVVHRTHKAWWLVVHGIHKAWWVVVHRTHKAWWVVVHRTHNVLVVRTTQKPVARCFLLCAYFGNPGGPWP